MYIKSRKKSNCMHMHEKKCLFTYILVKSQHLREETVGSSLACNKLEIVYIPPSELAVAFLFIKPPFQAHTTP